MNDTPLPSKHHNKPPIEDFFREHNEDLPARLADDCAELVQRTKDLADNAAGVPDVIDDDVGESKATDIVSQMKKHQKAADSRRLGISALPRTAVDIINGFFKTKTIDPLQPQIDRIADAVTKYKRIKEDRLRREREERERLAREEADRVRREKEEAERKKREAEEAAERAREEERRARAAAEQAKREQAEAEQRRKEAEARRIEQERLAEEAETQRKKKAAERAAREAKEAEEKAERDKKEAAERAKTEREKATQARVEMAETRSDVNAAARDVKSAATMVKHADADVAKTAKAAAAKASELTQSRGDMGSHSSLGTRWVGRMIDRNKVDKKELWPFFTDDHIQQAINKFVSVHKGNRTIAGVEITEETNTAFR